VSATLTVTGETARLNIEGRDDLGQPPGHDRRLRSGEETMIKRTVLIVVLSLAVSCLRAFAQAPLCNDSMIMATKGKWTTRSNPRPPRQLVPNEQYLQVTNRIDAVHPLLLEAYPELVGMEAHWSRVGGWPGGGLGATAPFEYTYRAGLFYYFCALDARPGSPAALAGAPFKPVLAGETNTRLDVYFNQLGVGHVDFFIEQREMRVNGLQVFYRRHPAGT
jgi:hypothetical protein